MKVITPFELSKVDTFYRASIAGKFSSAGVYNTSAIDVMRVSYEPTPRFLIEQAATNLLTYSEDFTQWTKLVQLGATDTSIGITLTRLIDSSAVNAEYALKDVTVANNSSAYYVSMFLKQYNTDNQSMIVLQLLNGTLIVNLTFVIDFVAKTTTCLQTSVVYPMRIINAANGIYRAEMPIVNNSTGNTTLRTVIYPCSTPALQMSVYAGGVQVEVETQISWPEGLQKLGATSYIKTVAAAVTRAEDFPFVTYTPFKTSPSDIFTTVSSGVLPGVNTWNSGTAYIVGDLCISGDSWYECLVNNTNYVPSGNPTKWLFVSLTNDLAMFDANIHSSTLGGTVMVVGLWNSMFRNTPQISNSLAILNFKATTITVVATQWSKIWYERTIDTTSITDLVLTDLPYINNILISVSFSDAVSTRCGKIVMGTFVEFGDEQYGATLGIVDYSVKNTDTFGNTTFTKRANARRNNYKISIANTEVDSAYTKLRDVAGTQVVFAGGNSLYSSMITYGFYKDFEIDIAYPKESYCTLSVDGVV